jgi:hypothetical protein
LPSWVHDDDVNTDQDGRTRDRRSYPTDDETSTLSEQVDLLGLVKGNILKSKNVRGDGMLLTQPKHLGGGSSLSIVFLCVFAH